MPTKQRVGLGNMNRGGSRILKHNRLQTPEEDYSRL